jgi:hypothetical protein
VGCGEDIGVDGVMGGGEIVLTGGKQFKNDENWKIDEIR